MFTYDRVVRFEDIDGAGIVFFARYLNYAHEVMENFFAPLEGGYVRLIGERKVGFPAVHLDVDYKAPLRYGDTARILMDVARIGNSSTVLRYRFTNLASGALLTEVKHTCVVSDLTRLRSMPMPADVRALLEAHLSKE